jgi:transposase-like protein/ribosomal protein L37AE/L43A
MEDYPRTLTEFEARFATEEACRAYLSQLRWPDGFVCPRCGGRESWTMNRGLWLCRRCRRQVSVTAGTIFQSGHLPLALWFRAMWYVTSQKNGASALGIQRILGLGSYETAWTWLHKLRRAMIRPGRERLCGLVEVDETYLGGLEEGQPGRPGTGKKALIVVAAEEVGRGIGRVRLRRIRDASAVSLCPFVQDAVETGSKVRTDGWVGYDGLAAMGYRHKVSIIARSKKRADQLLPHVHRVASLLKRWLLGTHQGAVSHDHLDYYLDEFTFRFNRRTSSSRGKLFYRLVQQAVQVAPQPYSVIVKKASRRALLPIGGG